MFKTIDPADYTVRPYRVYKTWTLNTGSEGIYGDEGLYTTGAWDWGTTEVTNSLSGRYKRSVFDQVKHCYYAYTGSPVNVFGGGLDQNQMTRSIHTRVNVISIPVRYMGTGIRPDSVTVTDGNTGATYTDDGYGNLHSASVYVGNVFYEHGLITCTDTGSNNTGSFLGAFDVQFYSTLTIYEHEVFCTVKEGEFNASTNPTAVSMSGTPTSGSELTKYALSQFSEYDYSSSVDLTGSYMAPYITTIGLYNDDAVLVAVAKLARPVKSLPDFPMNFLVRFDS